MKFIFAKKLGFCSGVRRAIFLAQSTLTKENRKTTGASRVYTLGPLIHNPQEVERLEELGIEAISDLSQIKRGTLIVPSHGLPESVLRKMERKGLVLIDATCPFVKRAQLLARRLSEKGYHVVIMGHKTHPEVVSLISFACGKASIVRTPQDVEKVRTNKKIGLISQTTQPVENFQKIARRLRAKAEDCKIYDTICRETSERQSEARDLARKSDIMIVIGGKNSANTAVLYRICKKLTCAYHVESAEELTPDWFLKKEKVGITAGTSTPNWVIRNVVKSLRRIKLHSA